jgi:putative heme-binding domain-containing protein
VRALATWESQTAGDSSQRQDLRIAVAKVQGDSGVLLHWRALGPLPPGNAAGVPEAISSPVQSTPTVGASSGWRSLMANGVDTRVDFVPVGATESDAVWLAFSDMFVVEPTRAQCLASSNGTLQVWLNGRSVYERDKAGAFQPDSDRFEAELTKGTNRLVVKVTGTRDAAQFHVRFRRLGSSAEHERVAQYALQNTGNAERGRELFFNLEKSACMKCHRLNDQGGRIGPDLTGVGSRFSRIHLIESILEPSRTIAPSYETITVALNNGRTVTGVKLSENETTLTLGDDQGQTHEIDKAEVDERGKQLRSTMPDGLEKRFSDREFLDLVTFLAAQRKK